jgi:hypothetical protein
MTPDAATVLVARSRPKVVALLALGAVTIFLTYLGLSAFDTSLPMIGPRRLGRPAKDLAVLCLGHSRRQSRNHGVADLAPAHSER